MSVLFRFTLNYQLRSEQLHSRGFSLIEVLIVASILGFVAICTSTFMLQAMKTQKSISLTNVLENTLLEAKMVLAQPGVCTHNLQFFSARTFDANAITDVAYPGIMISQISSPSSPTPILTNNSALFDHPGTNLTISLRRLIAMQEIF